MSLGRYPSLYQINTRVWLRELSRNPLRGVTLDEVGDGHLDSFAHLGFDWIWPLGVWSTGRAGRTISRQNPEWQAGFHRQLPDLRDDDITGSPYAVAGYSVHPDFGGDAALARFRERLQRRGMQLLLDFVPNHTALDHPWVSEHPEYYIAGSAADLAREPLNYKQVETKLGPRILAHGRDPYFPGWPDTLQLNYRCAGLRRAMIDELKRIAGRCDGVRCDMAMLLLPDVIQRTWGVGEQTLPADGTKPVDAPFWPEATAAVRSEHPAFVFMAEVYWDREWDLQQQGFDYTYDKRLYDRLRDRNAEAVRGHLRAGLDFQRKLVRFLENHDEERAASAFPQPVHFAAAVIAFLAPGLRFFHEGEFEGRRQHVSIHLGRRPAEPVDAGIRTFYMRLLDVLRKPAVRDGEWQLLDCRPAWSGSSTHAAFVAFSWIGAAGDRWLAAVNFGPSPGQCYLPLPWPEIAGKTVCFRDRMSGAVYERDGAAIIDRGLYLDVPDWHFHVFEATVR